MNCFPRPIFHLVTLMIFASPAFLCLPVVAEMTPEAGSEAENDTREATVTYVAGTSVYISAGSNRGIRIGDLVKAGAGGGRSLVLQVKEVSHTRSVCRPVDGSEPAVDVLTAGDPVTVRSRQPAAGDQASVNTQQTADDDSDPDRSQPSESSGHSAGSAVETAATESGTQEDGGPELETGDRAISKPAGFPGIRGRIGINFLAVQGEADSGFTQPGLSFRFDSDHLGGSAFGLNIDTRFRRTFRDSDVGDDSRNRFYRFSLGWQRNGSPYRVTLGRQYNSALWGVSVFDGVVAERDAERWAVGVFAGTQPDPENYGFSSDVSEYGVYARRRSAPDADRRWQVTGGLISSYDDGNVNREYLFAQAHYLTRLLIVFFNQEVDFNRDWKKDEGAGSVELTNTFASVRIRAGEALSFDLGYDDRRNIRLYRDYITPETEFDDANRRGLWGGAELRFLKRFRLGLRYRGNSGDDTGSSDSETVTFSAVNLFAVALGTHWRSTRFANDRSEGWLHSASVYMPVGRAVEVSIFGGMRTEDISGVVGNQGLDRQLVWYGLDVDFAIRRSWYLLLALERNQGDGQDYNQAYATVSYRF